jgi:DNA-binding SARP family transcriptional activator
MAERAAHLLSFPQAAGARFALQCWGEFSVSDRIRREESAPRSRKARAIIAYLALHGGAAVSRERLAALLWSERGDEQARGSLRQALGELRPYAAEPAGFLLIEYDRVRLNMGAVTSDVAQLEACARSDDVAALSQALGAKGELLFDGLDGLDPAFDEWLALERRVQLERLLSLAAGAAERGLERGEYGAIARLATQLQALDETNEAVAQIGMRADHACGDRSGLRRRRRRLCEALTRELGVGPSPETEALFRELEGAKPPAGAEAASVAPAAAMLDPASTPGAAPPEEAPPQPTRIAEAGEPAPGPPRRRPLALWRQRRGAVVAGLLVLVATAGGAAWLLRDRLPGHPASAPRVQLAGFTPLESDPDIRDFSLRLSDQVAGALKDNLAGLSIADPQDAASANTADLRLKGTVSRDGAGWRVKVAVEEPRRGVTLWAQDFRRPAQQSDMLESEVAGAAGEALGDTIDALQEKAARRDPQALALYVQGVAAIKNTMDLGRPERLLEDALARAPDFVGARATLAMVLAWQSQNADREPLVQRARLEAQRAIRADASAAGPAYDALYSIARDETPTDLVAAENLLREGIAKAPRFPFLPLERCEFLLEAGLAREAEPSCQQALAETPFTAWSGFIYANDLYGQGRPKLAISVLEKSLRYHPGDIFLRMSRYLIAAYAGAPDDMAALMRQTIGNGLYSPFAEVGPEEVARAEELFLQARRSRAPADVDKVLAAQSASVDDGKADPRFLVWSAAALGRPDAAFATLDQIAKGAIANSRLPGDVLFSGPSAPLWRDRRIWPLAAQAGYVRYWRTRGVWPDFCSDVSLPYDCRTEAAKVAGIKPLAAGRP